MHRQFKLRFVFMAAVLSCLNLQSLLDDASLSVFLDTSPFPCKTLAAASYSYENPIDSTFTEHKHHRIHHMRHQQNKLLSNSHILPSSLVNINPSTSFISAHQQPGSPSVAQPQQQTSAATNAATGQAAAASNEARSPLLTTSTNDYQQLTSPLVVGPANTMLPSTIGDIRVPTNVQQPTLGVAPIQDPTVGAVQQSIRGSTLNGGEISVPNTLGGQAEAPSSNVLPQNPVQTPHKSKHRHHRKRRYRRRRYNDDVDANDADDEDDEDDESDQRSNNKSTAHRLRRRYKPPSTDAVITSPAEQLTPPNPPTPQSTYTPQFPDTAPTAVNSLPSVSIIPTPTPQTPITIEKPVIVEASTTQAAVKNGGEEGRLSLATDYGWFPPFIARGMD